MCFSLPPIKCSAAAPSFRLLPSAWLIKVEHSSSSDSAQQVSEAGRTRRTFNWREQQTRLTVKLWILDSARACYWKALWTKFWISFCSCPYFHFSLVRERLVRRLYLCWRNCCTEDCKNLGAMFESAIACGILGSFGFKKTILCSPKLFKVKLWQRSQCAGEIWKRICISTVRPTVHTNPSWKRNFSKSLLKPEEFENAGVSSSYACGRRTFENEAFRKQWRHVNHVISLTEFSSNRNFEIIEWCLLKFCFKWTGPQCQYIS